MTPGQKAMLEDGAPACILITQEERRALRAQKDRTMISLTTNTRGVTQMSHQAKTFTEMSGSELVVAFNEMANSTLGKELGAKPVSRFADTKVGLKRVEMLASSIKARASGLKRQEDQGTETATETKTAKTTETPSFSEEEKEMGATAKKTTTKARKPAATGPLPKGPAGIVAQFGARAGTNRETLLLKLAENLGKFVSLNDLITATYGRSNKEDNKGATMMVLKGVGIMITAGRLPFKLEKKKDDDGHISFGLFKK